MKSLEDAARDFTTCLKRDFAEEITHRFAFAERGTTLTTTH